MFIPVLIMVTEKLPPSYAVPYNQLNSTYPYDNMKQYGDNNAFSNLSRNMTFSGASGNITSPPNSIGPNFTEGDNNFGHFVPDGMGDYGIRSGSIFAQHGSSNNPSIWNHRFH